MYILLAYIFLALTSVDALSVRIHALPMTAELIFADAAMLVRLPYPGIYQRSRKCGYLLVIDAPRTVHLRHHKKYRDDAGIIGSARLATKAYPSTRSSRKFTVEAYSRQEISGSRGSLP